MHNDSVLEVSENTLILKPLMASKTPRYRFFVFFLNTLVSVFNDTGNSTSLHSIHVVSLCGN